MDGDGATLGADVVACMDRFLAVQLSREGASLLHRLGGARLKEAWRASLEEAIRYSSDPAGLARYADACPVAGASSEEYGIRRLRIEGFGSLLAGVHFYGLDLGRPFIHLSAWDFEMEPTRVSELGGALWREFEVFQPPWFRMWVAGEDDPLMDSPGARPDQWLVAGSLKEIRQRNRPADAERITLTPDPGLGSFDDYTRCYARFHEENPGSKNWAQPEDRESLARCADAGAFFRVHVDGEPAGWIAARKDAEGPVSGWLIVEELLQARFRGRGLAPAMQRRFLDTLSGEDLVFGTIDADNAPSLRTAQRVGREIVGGWTFLPCGEG